MGGEGELEIRELLSSNIKTKLFHRHVLPISCIFAVFSGKDPSVFIRRANRRVLTRAYHIVPYHVHASPWRRRKYKMHDIGMIIACAHLYKLASVASRRVAENHASTRVVRGTYIYIPWSIVNAPYANEAA